MDKADVVLQVLDARDPQGCRSPALEKSVLASSNKRLVMVMLRMMLCTLNSPNMYIYASVIRS